MAISFDDLNGAAKKAGTYMKLLDGDNTFRIVGDILPGYTYWVKGASGKDRAFECLTFDRKAEKFNNSLEDPVRELGIKDGKGELIKCSWSYRCQVINRATGQVEILQLKKGMLGEIIKFAGKKKMDPTDHVKGCDITVNRKKTGPLPFNVAYSVDPFSMEPSPLSAEDLELISELKSMSEIYPVVTPAEQRADLQKHLNGTSEDKTSGDSVDQEAVSEL